MHLFCGQFILWAMFGLSLFIISKNTSRICFYLILILKGTVDPQFNLLTSVLMERVVKFWSFTVSMTFGYISHYWLIKVQRFVLKFQIPNVPRGHVHNQHTVNIRMRNGNC